MTTNHGTVTVPTARVDYCPTCAESGTSHCYSDGFDYGPRVDHDDRPTVLASVRRVTLPACVAAADAQLAADLA